MEHEPLGTTSVTYLPLKGDDATLLGHHPGGVAGVMCWLPGSVRRGKRPTSVWAEAVLVQVNPQGGARDTQTQT